MLNVRKKTAKMGTRTMKNGGSVAAGDRLAEAILYFIPLFKFIISDIVGTKISLN